MSLCTVQINDSQQNKKSDFSIEHILNKAGSTINKLNPVGNNVDYSECSSSLGKFPWLECTRYYPPKVSRNPKKEGIQKRQLGRHPRIPFTSQQLSVLENWFKENPYLSSEEVSKISTILELTTVRVKIWFQNRRARERKEGKMTGRQHSLETNIFMPNTNTEQISNTRNFPEINQNIHTLTDKYKDKT